MLSVLLVILPTAAGFAAPAPAPAPRPERAALEGIQASLEKAVSRVSRPAGLLFGRPSRAYHLKGYGAVVVLAPRALPRPRRQARLRTQDRAFDATMRDLERSIGEVHDPAQRRRLEETLASLRDGLPPGSHRLPRPGGALLPGDIETLQEQAEAFRREAERAMEKAERDVMFRLRVSDTELPAVPPSPPGPPPPPDPDPPVLAGWPFWFGEEHVDASPDRILSDVRAAIVSGLATYRGDLPALAPDEFVLVAVDFVPGMADRTGVRTVVARVPRRALQELRIGRLTAAAFRARVEFDEY